MGQNRLVEVRVYEGPPGARHETLHRQTTTDRPLVELLDDAVAAAREAQVARGMVHVHDTATREWRRSSW